MRPSQRLQFFVHLLNISSREATDDLCNSRQSLRRFAQRAQREFVRCEAEVNGELNRAVERIVERARSLI
uniref:Uncharacterized protein n=1 Tax=Globodera rostochiensis TaxID=31243 RepID=A0A914HYQ2_GLORO